MVGVGNMHRRIKEGAEQMCEKDDKHGEIKEKEEREKIIKKETHHKVNVKRITHQHPSFDFPSPHLHHWQQYQRQPP